MSSKRSSDPNPDTEKKDRAGSGDREARLAAALRQNLRRRNAQRAARAGEEMRETATDSDSEREPS